MMFRTSQTSASSRRTVPYIPRGERQAADQNPYYGRGNPNILTYRLTKVIIDWLGREPSAADFVAALGALDMAGKTVYRRVIAPREDESIERSSDVFPDYLLPIKSESPEPVITDDRPTAYSDTAQRYRI
jgi:hypothetical protein